MRTISFFVLPLLFCGTASAQDSFGMHGFGHAQMHEEYKNWHPPYNKDTSCCGDADCRPTRARATDEGWEAWNGKRWLKVPKDRVLPTDMGHDGRSHICEKNDMIYCFSPGPIKS